MLVVIKMILGFLGEDCILVIRAVTGIAANVGIVTSLAFWDKGYLAKPQMEAGKSHATLENQPLPSFCSSSVSDSVRALKFIHPFAPFKRLPWCET